jgi:hypothetical protein
LVFAAGAAVACGHAKGSVELSAQSMETNTSEPPPPPQSTAAMSEPAPSSSAPPPPMYDYPGCPLECRILRPHVRALSPDEHERIRTAIAPTINGLKSCIYGNEAPASYVRPPPVNLRFSDQGDLVDVGIDSSGFEQNVEGCMQSLAHGQSTVPQVKLDSGAATVMCLETCPRPVRATKKRK